MNRYTPRKSAEFEARQQRFDFGMACRFVASLVFDVKQTLRKWWTANRPSLAKTTVKAWHQLVLELDSIAQIPMVFCYR